MGGISQVLRDFTGEIIIFTINGKVSTTNSFLMSECRKKLSSYKVGKAGLQFSVFLAVI